MSDLSRIDAQQLVERAMKSMLDPNAPVEQLLEFFATDYQQNVDGTTLDFAGFIDHAQDLKRSITSAAATFETMLVDGSIVADIHVIDATKVNGEKVRVKVIAFFTIKNGKIVRVDELTHLLSGAPEDRNLGSRTNH